MTPPTKAIHNGNPGGSVSPSRIPVIAADQSDIVLSLLAHLHRTCSVIRQAIRLITGLILENYEKLITEKKDQAAAYYGIALTNFMLGYHQKALDFLIYSFELNPSNEIKFLDNFPYFDSTQLYVRLTDTL